MGNSLNRSKSSKKHSNEQSANVPVPTIEESEKEDRANDNENINAIERNTPVLKSYRRAAPPSRARPTRVRSPLSNTNAANSSSMTALTTPPLPMATPPAAMSDSVHSGLLTTSGILAPSSSPPSSTPDKYDQNLKKQQGNNQNPATSASSTSLKDYGDGDKSPPNEIDATVEGVSPLNNNNMKKKKTTTIHTTTNTTTSAITSTKSATTISEDKSSSLCTTKLDERTCEVVKSTSEVKNSSTEELKDSETILDYDDDTNSGLQKCTNTVEKNTTSVEKMATEESRESSQKKNYSKEKRTTSRAGTSSSIAARAALIAPKAGLAGQPKSQQPQPQSETDPRCKLQQSRLDSSHNGDLCTTTTTASSSSSATHSPSTTTPPSQPPLTASEDNKRFNELHFAHWLNDNIEKGQQETAAKAAAKTAASPLGFEQRLKEQEEDQETKLKMEDPRASQRRLSGAKALHEMHGDSKFPDAARHRQNTTSSSTTTCSTSTTTTGVQSTSHSQPQGGHGENEAEQLAHPARIMKQLSPTPAKSSNTTVFSRINGAGGVGGSAGGGVGVAGSGPAPSRQRGATNNATSSLGKSQTNQEHSAASNTPSDQQNSFRRTQRALDKPFVAGKRQPSPDRRGVVGRGGVNSSSTGADHSAPWLKDVSHVERPLSTVWKSRHAENHLEGLTAAPHLPGSREILKDKPIGETNI